VATGTGRDAENISNFSAIHLVNLGFQNIILFEKRLLKDRPAGRGADKHNIRAEQYNKTNGLCL